MLFAVFGKGNGDTRSTFENDDERKLCETVAGKGCVRAVPARTALEFSFRCWAVTPPDPETVTFVESGRWYEFDPRSNPAAGQRIKATEAHDGEGAGSDGPGGGYPYREFIVPAGYETVAEENIARYLGEYDWSCYEREAPAGTVLCCAVAKSVVSKLLETSPSAPDAAAGDPGNGNHPVQALQPDTISLIYTIFAMTCTLFAWHEMRGAAIPPEAYSIPGGESAVSGLANLYPSIPADAVHDQELFSELECGYIEALRPWCANLRGEDPEDVFGSIDGSIPALEL